MQIILSILTKNYILHWMNHMINKLNNHIDPQLALILNLKIKAKPQNLREFSKKVEEVPEVTPTKN